MKARILVLLLAAGAGCYQPTLSPQYPIVQPAGSGSASDGSAGGARKYGDGGQLTFGYLSRVAHGSELTGYGTAATPLSFTPCSSAGQGYQWNGSAFVCALFNSISGLTTNQTVKAASATSIANAWPADDATTWGVSNKFTIAEATGNTTIGGTSATSHVFLGNVAQFFITVKNTNATGFSAIDYYDSAGADHLGFGYSNLESISYLSLNSGDFKIGTTGNVQRAKIFSSTGDFNIGPTTSDPNVLFNVEGTEKATTNKSTNITWTSGTTGSLMFLAASGVVSQDNANLFWDATNARLGLGTTSPGNKLHAKASTSGIASAAVEHSSTGGYAAIDYIDSAAATQGRIGYGNSAVGITQLQGLLFFYSPNSKDIVFSNPTKNEIQFGMTDGSVYLMMQDGVSSSVSTSGTGRLRYNNSSHTFQGSVNGGSWADLAGSSGGVTSVSGTAPIVSTGGTAPTISVNTFDSTHAGVVPASGGGTTNFARADGTWATPAGSSYWVQVLSDTLTGGSLTGWNQRSGTWTADASGFHIDDGTTNPYLTYESGGSESAPFPMFDVAMEVDAEWTASAESTATIQLVLYGIAGSRATNGTTIAYISRNGVIGSNVQGGADVTSSLLGTLATGVFHTIRAETHGTAISVYFDGVLKVTAQTPPYASAGIVATRVGLCANSGHAIFKNLKIWHAIEPTW